MSARIRFRQYITKKTCGFFLPSVRIKGSTDRTRASRERFFSRDMSRDLDAFFKTHKTRYGRVFGRDKKPKRTWNTLGAGALG